MRAGRNWTFFTAGVAALSFALDAGAQKQAQHASGHPGKGVPFIGSPPGLLDKVGRGGGASERGPSVSKDTPGHGGPMPQKAGHNASQGKAKGRDDPDQPGENLQASAGNAGNAKGRQRSLHEIPSCD